MSESELWSVALAANNIQTMTLDQLDEAFQRGAIGENTLVWTEGMDNWLKLGEVLGEDEPAAPATAPSVAPQVAVQAAVPSAFPPVATRAPVAGSLAPQAVSRAPAALQSAPLSAPTSMSPMALSLGGDDLDLEGFGAKKSKAKWGYMAAAAVAMLGIGVTAANLSSGASGVDPGKAAAAAMPIAAGDQPLAVSEKSADAPLAGGGYKVSAAEEKRFKAEEEKEAELRTKMAAALANQPPPEPPKRKRGGGGGKRQDPSGGTGLKQGGAKYDPLNASLD